MVASSKLKAQAHDCQCKGLHLPELIQLAGLPQAQCVLSGGATSACAGLQRCYCMCCTVNGNTLHGGPSSTTMLSLLYSGVASVSYNRAGQAVDKQQANHVNGGARSAASAASKSAGSAASNCSRWPVAGCTNPSVCACSAGRPSCRAAACAAAARAGLPAPTMLPAAASELYVSSANSGCPICLACTRICGRTRCRMGCSQGAVQHAQRQPQLAPAHHAPPTRIPKP